MNKNLFVRFFLVILFIVISIFIYILSEKVDCKILGIKPNGDPIRTKNCWVQDILQVLTVFSFCLIGFFAFGMIKLNFGD